MVSPLSNADDIPRMSPDRMSTVGDRAAKVTDHVNPYRAHWLTTTIRDYRGLALGLRDHRQYS